MEQAFLSTLQIPKNTSPELTQAVKFLVSIICQMDIEHRLDFARRDDRMKRFFVNAAYEMGISQEDIQRIYDQADRDRAANDEAIIKEVFDDIRTASLSDWFKEQFKDSDAK